MFKKVAVVGGGAWGSVFANILTANYNEVMLWDREVDVVENMNSQHIHKRHLDKKFSEKIIATNSLQEAVSGKNCLFFCVSSQHLRDVLANVKSFISQDTVCVSLSKGIELTSNKTMTQIICEVLLLDKTRVAAVSGPNLAGEVLDKKPTATVVAGKSNEVVKQISQAVATQYFRPFASSDVLGVELCGALKNIIALAIGVANGRNYGFNAQSAIMSRGLEEIMRLGVSMGAQAKTFYGLAGVGDLITTCLSSDSRNYSFGLNLGKGLGFEQAKKRLNGVAEGCMTAKAALELAHEYIVPMPIVSGVHKILFDGASPDYLEKKLMNLPLYTEGLNSKKLI
ncbi:MAG: NAD(P)-dependent glycerol-3-phosphate dehydrogenase [Bifidobacteriaceae bacterium]|jgi:glycerol-3-phosphate dehydrogenase (NAD(P)+)|nr:NAD(P)-dependent glycerol-3-phosphate dehydrogenase [Bifidobacteriaceae bacterium]